MTALREALAAFDYRNLNTVPDLAGINTTTEFLSAEIHRRLAARAAAGDLGPDTAGRYPFDQGDPARIPARRASFEGPVAADA